MSQSSLFSIDEELLEPLARQFRFSNGIQHIKTARPAVIVDLGCGPKIRFFHFAKRHSVRIKKYYGIDPLAEKSLVAVYAKHPVISIINHPVEKKISLPTACADYVVAFAFFEHIDYPQEILKEAYRLLKPGGKLILTVPSPKAKSVLEFLSFQLGIISRREIEEHKRYLDKNSLLKLLGQTAKSAKIFHHYFEFGLNNLMTVTKR